MPFCSPATLPPSGFAYCFAYVLGLSDSSGNLATVSSDPPRLIAGE
jgi:hypothetical protein